jgi:charged multivesicular body protein 7
MLKRKIPDYDAPDSSIFGDVPARNKRLFRRKDSCRTPQRQNIMPELLEYILQHEEAFEKCTALSSIRNPANM